MFWDAEEKRTKCWWEENLEPQRSSQRFALHTGRFWWHFLSVVLCIIFCSSVLHMFGIPRLFFFILLNCFLVLWPWIDWFSSGNSSYQSNAIDGQCLLFSPLCHFILCHSLVTMIWHPPTALDSAYEKFFLMLYNLTTIFITLLLRKLVCLVMFQWDYYLTESLCISFLSSCIVGKDWHGKGTGCPKN